MCKNLFIKKIVVSLHASNIQERTNESLIRTLPQAGINACLTPFANNTNALLYTINLWIGYKKSFATLEP